MHLEELEKDVDHFAAFPFYIKFIEVYCSLESELFCNVGHRNQVVLFTSNSDSLEPAIHLIFIKLSYASRAELRAQSPFNYIRQKICWQIEKNNKIITIWWKIVPLPSAVVSSLHLLKVLYRHRQPQPQVRLPVKVQKTLT